MGLGLALFPEAWSGVLLAVAMVGAVTGLVWMHRIMRTDDTGPSSFRYRNRR